jgi:hypothetical protein
MTLAEVIVAFCLSMSVTRAEDTRSASVAQLQVKVDAVLGKVMPAVVGLKKGATRVAVSLSPAMGSSLPTAIGSRFPFRHSQGATG